MPGTFDCDGHFRREGVSFRVWRDLRRLADELLAALCRILAAILRSHALIHSAEGEILPRCDGGGLQELRGARDPSEGTQEVRQVSNTLKPPGPPWRMDHKPAAAALLLALSGA